jgi:hypothetical protein
VENDEGIVHDRVLAGESAVRYRDTSPTKVETDRSRSSIASMQEASIAPDLQQSGSGLPDRIFLVRRGELEANG